MTSTISSVVVVCGDLELPVPDIVEQLGVASTFQTIPTFQTTFNMTTKMQNMMKRAAWTLLLAALWAPADVRAQSRTFTVFNACPFTIWCVP